MYRLGVIPAAGKAERFGGLIKELMPFGEYLCLIEQSVYSMKLGGADALLVITNADKIGHLSRFLSSRYTDRPIYYAIQRGSNDIWSAIEESFAYPADVYLFAMPDTLFSDDVFDFEPVDDFIMGVFETDKPERYGTIRNGQVVNKEPGDLASYTAWGTLVWTWHCVNFWKKAQPIDYTDAINRALDEFGIHCVEMDTYHDMASFDDYRDWLAQRTRHGEWRGLT